MLAVYVADVHPAESVRCTKFEVMPIMQHLQQRRGGRTRRRILLRQTTRTFE